MTQALTAGDDTPPSRQTPASPQIPEPPPVPLRADSPEPLLALLPHLLGFARRTSVFVIGTERPGNGMRVTLRYGLPDPPGAGIAADLAAHAVGVLTAQ